MFRRLACIAALATTSCAGEQSTAPVQVSSGATSTSVVAQVCDYKTIKSARLANPDRVYFDVQCDPPQPRLRGTVIDVNDSRAVRVRSGERDGGVFRIVIELVDARVRHKLVRDSRNAFSVTLLDGDGAEPEPMRSKALPEAPIPVKLHVGESIAYSYPFPVTRFQVTNPIVASVHAVSPSSVALHADGVSSGGSVIVRAQTVGRAQASVCTTRRCDQFDITVEARPAADASRSTTPK